MVNNFPFSKKVVTMGFIIINLFETEGQHANVKAHEALDHIVGSQPLVIWVSLHHHPIVSGHLEPIPKEFIMPIM